MNGFLRRSGRNPSSQPNWNGNQDSGRNANDGHHNGRSSFNYDGGSSDPGNPDGGVSCDQDPSSCNRCMTRMDDLEAALLSNTARVSNLKQAKSRKI